MGNEMLLLRNAISRTQSTKFPWVLILTLEAWENIINVAPFMQRRATWQYNNGHVYILAAYYNRISIFNGSRKYWVFQSNKVICLKGCRRFREQKRTLMVIATCTWCAFCNGRVRGCFRAAIFFYYSMKCSHTRVIYFTYNYCDIAE